VNELSAPPPAEDVDASRAPLMDHLVELRKRLIWSFASLLVAFFVAFYFVDPIFTVLVQPLLEAGHDRMIFTGVMEAFFTRVKVAFFAAIMISFPILATQLWLFIAPGLYKQERKAFLPFLLMTPVLFILGSSLAYFFAVPVALHFLLGFEGDLGGVTQEALPGVGNYLDFITKFLFGFGVAFLLPVLLMLVERAGLVRLEQLQKGRRYAIVVAFVIAAVLTPPDVISQLLLAIPLVVLYEAALIGIRITRGRRERRIAAES
jgi:sec-independent protein translocase protein TatC